MRELTPAPRPEAGSHNLGIKLLPTLYLKKEYKTHVQAKTTWNSTYLIGDDVKVRGLADDDVAGLHPPAAKAESTPPVVSPNAKPCSAKVMQCPDPESEIF